jgi:hypothetical protein
LVAAGFSLRHLFDCYSVKPHDSLISTKKTGETNSPVFFPSGSLTLWLILLAVTAEARPSSDSDEPSIDYFTLCSE